MPVLACVSCPLVVSGFPDSYCGSSTNILVLSVFNKLWIFLLVQTSAIRLPKVFDLVTLYCLDLPDKPLCSFPVAKGFPPEKGRNVHSFYNYS